MKIGIDARLYYETGVGRYIRNLIVQLQVIDKSNHYVVFLPKKAFAEVKLTNDRWEKRSISVPWHSIFEQTLFIPQILKERLDLMHFPYFSFPILYPKPFVVTIHDLIIDHYDTGRATTHNILAYKLRRFGYFLNTRVGLHRAERIIAVSKATKDELIDHIGLESKKITVIYEGVDKQLLESKKTVKNPIAKPYFLYVGNAYPHKNLEMVIDAFAQLYQFSPDSSPRLVMVGKDDYFYTHLKDYARSKDIAGHIQFFGQADDAMLQSLYFHALALVAPSHMEGFGLPILEAMANNCAVFASNIAVFRELFGDCLHYFNLNDKTTLVTLLKEAMKKPEKWHQKKTKAKKRVQKFSWEKTAKETLQVYNGFLPA